MKETFEQFRRRWVLNPSKEMIVEYEIVNAYLREQREEAERILMDNMSDNTAKHIAEIDFLTEYIIDAMLEFKGVDNEIKRKD